MSVFEANDRVKKVYVALEKNPKGLTVSAIAKETGLAQSSIYRYFENELKDYIDPIRDGKEVKYVLKTEPSRIEYLPNIIVKKSSFSFSIKKDSYKMTKIRCFINHSDKMVITTESYTSGKAFDKADLELYQDGKKLKLPFTEDEPSSFGFNIEIPPKKELEFKEVFTIKNRKFTYYTILENKTLKTNFYLHFDNPSLMDFDPYIIKTFNGVQTKIPLKKESDVMYQTEISDSEPQTRFEIFCNN